MSSQVHYIFIGAYYLIRLYGKYELLMQVSEIWNNFGQLQHFEFLAKYLYFCLFTDIDTFVRLIERDYFMVTSLVDRLHSDESVRGDKIGYSFDFLSPQSKLAFDKMQASVLNLNIIERVLNNLMIIATDTASDKCSGEPVLAVLRRTERVLEKFTFKQLNETSMNYRNILLQNLFKIAGIVRERFPAVDLRTHVIEFYNQELHNQDNIDNYSYKKTLDLKSLLNVGVCLNGGFSRVHE